MKKTFFRFFSVLICAAVLGIDFSSAAFAKIPSPSRYFYVYDEANVLSLTTEDHIITVNDSLSVQCGSQIVVACVNTTGNSDIADYAFKLFNKWEIGDKEKKNGVLVLLAIDDGDYYALQGKGLENLLSSGTLKLLLDQYLEPSFSKGAYDEGVLSIFDELVRFISQIYSVSVGQSSSAPAAPVLPTTEFFSVEPDENEDEDEDFDVDLFEGSFEALGTIGSSIASFFSELHLFQGVGQFLKKLSLRKIILIIIVILLLRSLIGKRRHSGGGSSHRG